MLVYINYILLYKRSKTAYQEA